MTDLHKLDIPDAAMLGQMHIQQYRAFLRDEIYVDHHDVLVLGRTGQALATSKEQVGVLIEELQQMNKERMVDRH